MTRLRQLATLGISMIVLGACSSNPYQGFYEDVNAAKTAYIPGVNDQQTYSVLGAKLEQIKAQAANDIGKPKPTLAANFVSMTAADAMANVGEIAQAEFADAQVSSLDFADKVKTACSDGLKSGIDELDGALCSLSIATLHLNSAAYEPRKFGEALAESDWVKAKEANEAFAAHIDNRWTKIDSDIAALPEADQNKTPAERMAFYRVCQMQKAQQNGATSLLSSGLASEGPKRAAQLAYLNTMQKSANYFGSAISTPAKCNDDPEGLPCQSQTEQLIGTMCSEQCAVSEGQQSALKMSCDWNGG